MACLIISMGPHEGVWILEEGKSCEVTQDLQENECAVVRKKKTVGSVGSW